jgi:hypothetical protein
LDAASGIGHNGGPPIDELLSATIKDACRLSGFSRDAMYAVINAGEVESFLMGSRRFVVIPSLRSYIATRASEPLRSGRLLIRRRSAGGTP